MKLPLELRNAKGRKRRKPATREVSNRFVPCAVEQTSLWMGAVLLTAMTSRASAKKSCRTNKEREREKEKNPRKKELSSETTIGRVERKRTVSSRYEEEEKEKKGLRSAVEAAQNKHACLLAPCVEAYGFDDASE